MLHYGVLLALTGLFPPYTIDTPDIVQLHVHGLPKKMPALHGEHLVRPDGTISLGAYGSCHIAGLTTMQAQAALRTQLAKALSREQLAKVQVYATVTQWNSRVYYVVHENTVVRLPLRGNETVLDAVKQSAATDLAKTGRVWIVRPRTKAENQTLPVDWHAILQGKTATNYQLQPGDRLYIQADPMK